MAAYRGTIINPTYKGYTTLKSILDKVQGNSKQQSRMIKKLNDTCIDTPIRSFPTDLGTFHDKRAVKNEFVLIAEKVVKSRDHSSPDKVYIMSNSTEVKVGVATDVIRRRNTLNTSKGDPFVIETARHSIDPFGLETLIKKEFQAYHLSGEVFRKDPGVLDKMKSILLKYSTE